MVRRNDGRRTAGRPAPLIRSVQFASIAKALGPVTSPETVIGPAQLKLELVSDCRNSRISAIRLGCLPETDSSVVGTHRVEPLPVESKTLSTRPPRTLSSIWPVAKPKVHVETKL